ncbi:MAG: 3-hydroxyacyl-CoA dehydrogenase NAD-binding domain-containing protein [Coxiellaceae bacterium]|nr:3-hydroxyacyl-CoA dehydrogenase NAD-binding domain-containing protein [Coxiellaceae bacterium]
MSSYGSYKNFKIDTDEDNIVWLGIDREGMKVNSLDFATFEEFDKIISEVKDKKPKGLIIYSAKKNGFVAGADINQFVKLKDTDEAYKLVRQAQQILDRLEALSVPTVAMINGFAMGGGCELALACRYRVALDDPKTKIGLPEIKLGIQPGWGGTVRLPKLIGAPKAMGIILAGRVVSANAARKMGIVDAAVPLRELKRAAKYYVCHQPKPHQASFAESMTNSALIRPLLAKAMRKQLSKKAIKAHYPAPFQVVDNWVKVGVGSQAMDKEARSISELLVTPTSRNLVRVFFLSERMKGLAKGLKFKPQHVHVVGAGTMGGDIAAWCALRGLYVTLQDRAPENIAPAIKRAYKLFKKKLKKPRLIQAAMDRLQPDVAGEAVGRADVIIEAIFENLEVKQQLFKDLEAKAKPGAILATNTSSIPLDEINQVLTNPERLVGIHFFNPVAMMPLVEVVHGEKTSKESIDSALAFVGKISKQPIPVKSSPGFLVNRVLMPYLMEAMELLKEGVSATMIDKVAMKFGMPMGPVTLADTVGLDVCLAVAENLGQHYGGDIPQQLRDMVAAKNLGRKTGKGFYSYKGGKQEKPSGESDSTSITKVDIQDRLMLRMVNESVACLREGVVEDKELLDGGMIFGTGFAPFRGGPIHYSEDRGLKDTVDRLQDLSTRFGQRFTPDAGWQALMDPSKSAKSEGAKKKAAA